MSGLKKTRLWSLLLGSLLVTMCSGCQLLMPWGASASRRPDPGGLEELADLELGEDSPQRTANASTMGGNFLKGVTEWNPYGEGLEGPTGNIGREAARGESDGIGVSLTGKGRDIEANLGMGRRTKGF